MSSFVTLSFISTYVTQEIWPAAISKMTRFIYTPLNVTDNNAAIITDEGMLVSIDNSSDFKVIRLELDNFN